ncbi:hypothetical protein ACIQLG_14075 [Terribacillus saccharophilus]|uniref:hypothetical protein n=1 Tax=Terribacillus saccharophilus TaxID=361277 RepID=UPI00382325A7
MNWLNKIDIEYAKVTKDKENKLFIYYPNHNLLAMTEGVKFIFSKQGYKTKILFEDEYGRRLYLTDVDIINIIVSAKEEVFLLLQRWMIEHEQNKFDHKILLEIEKEPFELPLSVPNKSCEKEILDSIAHCTFETAADFSINYIDLMILISLIVDKEMIVSEANGHQRKSRQLKKFIILSEYFRSGKYKDQLNEKNFLIDTPIENIYFDSKVAKKIDLMFDELEY